MTTRKTAEPVLGHGRIAEFRRQGVVIDTDEKLSSKEVDRIARQVRSALDHDRFEQKLGPSKALTKKPVTVGVFSDKQYASFTGDTSKATFGQAIDRNTLIMRDSLVHGKDGGDLAVLAHELGHIQDSRLAGKRANLVPSFLREGKAVLLGDRFVKSIGRDNPAIAESAKALGGYTADDARAVFQSFRGNESPEIKRGNGARDERLGALYVEFLRTRFNGGTPNALARLARVTRDVGRGQSFDDAFAKRFGAKPADAEKAFVDFMASTQGNPQERLRGTLFAA